LVAINRAIISSLDYDEVLSLIVEKTAKFAEADTCVLLLTNGSSQATVAAAVGVALEKVRDFSAPLDERIGGALRELLDFQPADRFMGVPVVLRGRIAGILAVYWRGPEPPPPEDDDGGATMQIQLPQQGEEDWTALVDELDKG
jgi:GAF domain-containing protein